ncbi:hypothetical protein Mgra_00006622, partial [Meloidogyne graminicola]
SLVIIIGWLITSVLKNNVVSVLNSFSFTLTNLFVDKSSKQFSIIYNNILTIFNCILICIYIITAGINAPILIISNSEYRNAYKTIFGKLIPKLKIFGNQPQPLFIRNNQNNQNILSTSN